MYLVTHDGVNGQADGEAGHSVTKLETWACSFLPAS